jgi:hypothetical protein
MQKVLNEDIKPETQSAWEFVFGYFAEKMTIGFRNCEKLNQQL